MSELNERISTQAIILCAHSAMFHVDNVKQLNVFVSVPKDQ
jgi:hypothetical protein